MRVALRPSVIALTTIIFGGFVGAASQRPPTAADVVRDMIAAERLLQEQKADAARSAFEAILEPARQLALESQEAGALCGIGEALYQKTQYRQAEQPLLQCLAIYERLHADDGIGRASMALGSIAELSGEYQKAVALEQQAIAAFSVSGNVRGRAMATLQRVRLRDLTFAERQTLYELVVDDARRLGDRDIEGRALHSWGDRLFSEDRFEEALEKLESAKAALHAAGSLGGEGTVFNSMGRVYRAHGRLDQALTFQLRALEIHKAHGSLFELMQSHNAVAAVEQMMGNLTAAREHYERALAIAERSSSPRTQDFLRANIGGLLIGEGQYARGAEALEEVIAHGLDAFEGMRQTQLSTAYLRLKRPERALAAAERAFNICGTEQTRCLDALQSRADAHAALRDNEAALTDVRMALDAIEGLRSKLVPSDFLKQNFHQSQQNVYNSAIAIGFAQHRERESLQTAEMARSRAFLDLLAARDVRLDDRGVIAALTYRGGASIPFVGLQSPAMAAPTTAGELAAIATRLHSTLVAYWVADNELFIWVMAPDGSLASRRVEMSKTRLVSLIRATTPFNVPSEKPAASSERTLGTRGSAQIAMGGARPQAWRELYDVLIAPVRDQLPRDPGSLLTIVPHGPLLNLSFAALQDRRGRYLLEDYTVHYAPAGAVLQFTAARRHPDARRGDVLLVADPTLAPQSPLDPQLPPLPGARREVARIARLVAPERVTLLEGSRATDPAVREAAAGKSIVHFATHAIVRDEDPNGSYLALGPGDEHGKSHGLLTAQDVYGLRLDADLVVLSACRSGGGPVTGDGIATFARAFMYAGAPSLVVSLWDVADEPTSRLLPAFYEAWFGRASKATSLRRAQLQLLADLRAGTVRVETRAGAITLPEDPIFWAGFVLIGEPD